VASAADLAPVRNDRWITTLAACVGVAANNWLFYAKGGGGVVGVQSLLRGASRCPQRTDRVKSLGDTRTPPSYTQ
jgi:hypothetical protein